MLAGSTRRCFDVFTYFVSTSASYNEGLAVQLAWLKATRVGLLLFGLFDSEILLRRTKVAVTNHGLQAYRAYRVLYPVSRPCNVFIYCSSALVPCCR
jgi:hypothetical protein